MATFSSRISETKPRSTQETLLDIFEQDVAVSEVEGFSTSSVENARERAQKWRDAVKFKADERAHANEVFVEDTNIFETAIRKVSVLGGVKSTQPTRQSLTKPADLHFAPNIETSSSLKFGNLVKFAKNMLNFKQNPEQNVQASKGGLTRTTSLVGVRTSQVVNTRISFTDLLYGDQMTRVQELREAFAPPELEKMQARENMMQSIAVKSALASPPKITKCLEDAEERMRKYDQAMRDLNAKQTGEFFKSDVEKALEDKMHQAYRELFHGEEENKMVKNHEQTRRMDWAEEEHEEFVYKKDGTVFGNAVRGYTSWSHPKKGEYDETDKYQADLNQANANLMKAMRGADDKITKEEGRSWRNAVHQRYRKDDQAMYEHGVLYCKGDDASEESVLSDVDEADVADVLDDSTLQPHAFDHSQSSRSNRYGHPEDYGSLASGSNQDRFRELFSDTEEDFQNDNEKTDSDVFSGEDDDEESRILQRFSITE
eukprot:CAMPEP_0196578564 /NCGR_PEP_ID=MMETSP1081-20130531/7434_1 /TAXON_ID=36882 /ORGANISM="Pyramimonas amylifera, Strain CCMP720" /LENGTH=485 /DNA_ID=CAMNT_0041897829 /DNA_START=132 /DNA_END=1589 /DNA_ORIENTATION=+